MSKFDTITTTPTICFNRQYRGGRFLSPYQICEGCIYEVGDLFHGTAGKSFYGWYCCTIEGEGEGENG